MKLFTPQQAKQNFNTKQEVDISQIAYVENTLRELQERINIENANFEKRLEEQRKVYSEEKSRLQADLRVLDANVQALRLEREQLMIPIDTLKAEAQKTHELAQARLVEIQAKEEEVEELLELTHSRLDFATEEKEKAIALKDEILAKKKGIQAEAKMVSDSHERLNKLIAEFNLESQKKIRELEEREVIIEIKEKNLESYIKSSQRNFEYREMKLKDKSEKIRMALEELKQKKNEFKKR